MMEIILMIGILLAVFPIIQRSIRGRSESLRNEYVIKDMMRLKSAVENFLERRIYTLDFYENPVIEMSGKDLEVFYETGLPKGFKSKNMLGQDYAVKIRRHESAPGEPFEYDAIVIAHGGPSVSDLRVKEIAKESKGYGGYVEDGIIYGQSWSYDVDVWKGKTGIAPDSLVFKTGFLRRDYQYISRVNERYARMNANLDMNLNNIYGVGSMRVAGDAEANDFKVDSDAKAVTETMTVLSSVLFR
ncbi:MAG: shufflon system plasmid conjugative transfer pilus tip adhesin PilV, partial [Rickettsiales bacterium]|nr:shufflon system plasmid conjugative transfer pilus tip adhesin PilV [Rickettsiales bacterium]